MLLQDFPDLNWLKSQIKKDFESRRGWDNSSLPNKGWPSVVLNTKTAYTERIGIKGPFSVFMNLEGSSIIKIAKSEQRLTDSTFTFTNSGETYDLLVPKSEVETTTFNIHFGEKFCKDAFHHIRHNDATLLDKPLENSTLTKVRFGNYFKTLETQNLILSLKASYLNNDDRLLKEDLLFKCFNHFYYQGLEDRERLTSLTKVRKSTVLELQKRLSLAIDFMHSHFDQPLDLDSISRQACLSKFHFLRLFKESVNESPYQYIKKLRLEKGLQLLKLEKLPINQVAVKVGFENPSSFSRAFFRTYGQYPTHFLNAN